MVGATYDAEKPPACPQYPLANRKASGPDGLEAWCVALSACFINFVMAGLGRMSGILYVAFIDIFKVDRLQASVPFSARSLTRNLLGPAVGIIGQKYGVRAATLLGGVIGTISAIACFYASSILWITVMWGAVNGCGTALTITLPQVVLGQHFKKYKTTASGMAFSGGCVGSFLFPVLLEFLLHTYGLGGTFLVLGGIIMNVIPAAMVLKKPSWLSCNSRHSEKGVKRVSKDQLADDDNSSFQENAQSLPSDSSNNSVQRVMQDNGEYFPKIETHFLLQNNRLISLLLTTNFADRHADDKCCRLRTSNLQKELEEMYKVIEHIFSDERFSEKRDKYKKYLESNFSRGMRHSSEERQIIEKLERHTKIESREIILLLLKSLLKEDMKNIITLFPEDEHRCISKIIVELRKIYNLLSQCNINYNQNSEQSTLEKSEKCDKSKPHANTFSAHIKTAFRLHTNPIFLLISLCRSVHFLTFVPAVTIIVDFSMDKGLLEGDGKYVIAALSFGDLMGRIGLGWVTDKEYISLPRYMLIVMIMQGACTACLSLTQSKITLLSLITIFGLLQGSLFVRHPVLVSKYLGSHEQSVAMGCFNFFSGLLGFTLPNYIGYFRDTIGSYDCIFYINGAIGTFVGILWFFEPLFVRCINRNTDLDAQSNV